MLARTDDRLSKLLDALHEPVMFAAPDGTLLEANRAAHDLFGYAAGEMVGRHRTELTDPADARVSRAVDRRLRDGSAHANVTCRRRDGTTFEAELAVAVIGRPEGDLLWIVIHDQDQRQRADAALEALRTSEERFRALSEATFEGVLIHDGGRVLLANRAAERMVGAEPGGLVGRNVFDFVTAETQAIARSHIAQNDPRPYEAQGKRLDGTVFPIEAQGREATLQGQPVRVVGLRDVTERRQLEASLALADRMASLGTLSAGVAHEINNPLGTLLLNLELAVGHLEAGSVSTALGEIGDALRAARRIQQVVRDFRAMSRMDTAEPGPTDVRTAVDYALGIARHQIRHRAELVVDLQDVPPVRANESRLAQVVLNLLINAVQSIPDGVRGRIGLRVFRYDDRRVAVEVSDDGVGIPAEARPRIFEPFFTTKPVGVGTGLGLAICYSIVASFGGEIVLDSEVDRGSTFRVLLASTTADAPVAATPEPPAAIASQRARILVLDDEVALQAVCRRVLEAHDVTTVSAAEDGLMLLAGGRTYDLVLCDLMMPGMGGEGFLAEIDRRWPALADRVLLMTGGAVTAEAERALARARRPPLDKPFSVQTLQTRVNEVLASLQPAGSSRPSAP